MSQKLQELTEKLYREGVEKARAEADKLMSEAESERAELLKNAQADAEDIVKRAEEEAASLVAKGKSELQLAARQALKALKQETVNILSQNTLSSGVTAALDEKEFIGGLIKDIVEAWTSGDAAAATEVHLPAGKETDFAEYMRNALRSEIEKGLVVSFDGRMAAGFTLVSKDGSYMMSFTDEDFQAFFSSFMKERTRAILFKEN